MLWRSRPHRRLMPQDTQVGMAVGRERVAAGVMSGPTARVAAHTATGHATAGADGEEMVLTALPPRRRLPAGG